MARLVPVKSHEEAALLSKAGLLWYYLGRPVPDNWPEQLRRFPESWLQDEVDFYNSMAPRDQQQWLEYNDVAVLLEE